jgi:hypothetical protein
VFGRNRTPADPERPYWSQRSWQISAGFLGLVVLMAGVAWLVSDGDGSQNGTPAARGPLSEAVAADGRPEGCRTDDSAKELPGKPPADIRWERLTVGKAPLSASAGPVRTTGPVRWCFARTPMGAVLAAHVIPAQMSGAHWRTVAEQQVVEGIPRRMFIAQRETLPEPVPGAGSTQQSGSFVGYRLTAYSADAATVQLLLKDPAGTYGTTSVSVRWDGGDWKITPEPTGSLYTQPAPVTGNAGFAMWKV